MNSPIQYSEMLWAIAFGYLFFGYLPIEGNCEALDTP
ncbi:hypothetical protein J2Z17_001508 [Rhizobium halophytocola]|uniref:Uncharacterized protein n=1 Tax=Rhizobium halophytocola TaxID=735519 RepID=A0ABS4DWM0_9HYPH|nr:hypothetical protein [Rhizobium halophytocola]